MSDENGPPSDDAIPLLLDAAEKFSLKVKEETTLTFTPNNC